MVWTRNLSKGDSGQDVLAVKQLLFRLGYYEKHVTEIKKDTFGNDTDAAVRAFQRRNRGPNGQKLAVDGIVGRQTMAALDALSGVERPAEMPDHIGVAAARAIAAALAGIPQKRRMVVMRALPFAFDASSGERDYPLSLYIRGGNLFDSKGKLMAVTIERIEREAKARPKYYDGGRKELMLAAVRQDTGISGADCSGGIVGLFRKEGLVLPSFDATADTLNSDRYSERIEREELMPGDFVGRPQHIGLYMGGGYAAEWIGGSYGCQLTAIEDRRAWDFIRRRSVKLGAWTRFRRPHAFG